VEIDLDNKPGLLECLEGGRRGFILGDSWAFTPCRAQAARSPYLSAGCELVSHNVTVRDLQRRVDGVLQKGRELLEASAELRGEKLDFEVRLLSRFEELQRAWEEVSELQGRLFQPNQRSLLFGSRSMRSVRRSYRSSAKSIC